MIKIRGENVLSDLIKNKKYKYKLSLCKMNYEYIMPIEYTALNFTRKFNDYDELTVSIPKKVSVYSSKKGSYGSHTINNPAWDKTISGSIILVMIYDGNKNIFSEYFTVSDFILSSEQSTKDLSCIAAHQSLFNRLNLSGYEQIRKLYEYDTNYTNGTSFDINDNTSGGILNYILEYKLGNKNYSSSKNFWKVTYYDEALNDIFDYNDITESDLNSLRANVSYYWHISRRYDSLDAYSGNISKTWEDGSNKFTVKKWAYKFNELLSRPSIDTVSSTQELTDLYLNRIYLQNTINKILECIDDSIDKLYISSSFENIKKDTYIGTKLLTSAEEALSNLQAFIDAMITENNASKDEITSYIEECMLLFTDITQNLITPLLIFKGAGGRPPYRYMHLDGVNLTDAFSQIADSYCCVFEFNNYNKEIKIYSRNNENINKTNSIPISDKNLIKEIQRQDNHEKIITRLYITGKDDATISGITYNGERYVDDFSYFMKEEYMSPDLINALIKYKEKTESYIGETGKGLLETLIGYDQKYESKMNDFMYLYDYYVKYVYSSSEYEDIGVKLNKAIHNDDKVQTEVLKEEQSAMYKIVASYMSVLDGTLDYEESHWCGTDYAKDKAAVDFFDGTSSSSSSSLNGGDYADKMKKFFDNCYYIIAQKYSLQDTYKYDKVLDNNGSRLFSGDLLSELENFIFESEETADTISDKYALLYYAKNYMDYINKVPITININLADILSSKKYQSMWERLNKVGDLISIDYPAFGLNKSYFRLLSYTHDPVSSSLEMTFGNSYEIQNIYNTFLNGVVKTALDLSKSSSKYQSSWDEYLQKKELYLQEGKDIDASINSIRSNGKLIIGKGGITLSKCPDNAIKQYADGLYSPNSNLTNTDFSSIYSSDSGIAADITVNSVKTDYKRSYNYLKGIRDNINYIYLHDEKFLFISDMFYSEEPIGLTGADGTKMYWKTDPLSWEGGITLANISKQMTSSPTDYSVNVYQYTSYTKGSWSFEDEILTPEDSSEPVINAIPVLTIGTGDGSGNGTAKIRKDEDGLYISYKSRTSSDMIGIKIKDDNIYQIKGTNEYIMYPMMIVDEMPSSFPEDILVFVKQQ